MNANPITNAFFTPSYKNTEPVVFAPSSSIVAMCRKSNTGNIYQFLTNPRSTAPAFGRNFIMLKPAPETTPYARRRSTYANPLAL